MIIGVPYKEPNTPPFELEAGIAIVSKDDIKVGSIVHLHGESASGHILQGELVITSLLAEIGNGLLNLKH